MSLRLAYLVGAPGVPVQGPSGCSAHVRALAKAFSAVADTRVYAACKADHRGVFGEDQPAWVGGVPGWPSWLSRYRELREVWAARRVGRRLVEDGLSGWMPDLVVERHTLFSDAGWRASTRLHVPHVLEVNAPLLMERERFETVLRPDWARGWERDVLLAAPAIAAVSRWLVRWLRSEVGCRNVRWVPNGVVPYRGDRARGRERLGLSPDEPAIGFVGSFKPWHGHQRLGAVAAAVDARLVLIGEGNASVSDLDPERVIRTGFLDGLALADAIAALDVGLAPYPADAPPWFCPLKIFDYRARGVPVVTTDVGDGAVLVRGGGLAVPPDDEDAFIEAVRRCLQSARPPVRVRSWDTVAREILELGLG